MTYADTEVSAYQGEPIELYKFSYLGYNVGYCTGDESVLVTAVEYDPVPIKRTDINATVNGDRASITVTIPHDLAIAELWRTSSPQEVINLTVFRLHRSDVFDVVTLFLGRVINAAFKPDDRTLELEVETVFSSLNRIGLRRKFQLQCSHMLYGTDCKVNKFEFEATHTVVTGSGTQIELDPSFSPAANYYVGGMVIWADEVTGFPHRRLINSHSGQILDLMTSVPDLPEGLEVQVYAGCNHTMTDCIEKFDNINNFGGFPHMPIKNPFDGV